MSLQFFPDGRFKHFLSLEGVPRSALEYLLDSAQQLHVNAMGGTVLRHNLQGKTVCNLFFENSTRTRSSFLLAAQRLGADVFTFDASTSSGKKGETDIDTLKNLEAMGVNAFVIRHSENGAVEKLAQAANPGTCVINAGDGRHQHPTQGLLDMLSIRQVKGHDFSKLKILIAGDIKHSRVARSDLNALRTLNTGEVRVCGPASLLPEDDTIAGCERFEDFDQAIKGVDVVMMLRLQRERMEEALVASLDSYFRDYGLTQKRLASAKTNAIVMHPGPMNRGVEIANEVADGPQSIILPQVSNGVAARMAVLNALLA
ncbi:MAG: aspartate carbamoyltransferase catalytic subunit [Arenimonas sp.]